MSKQVKLCVEVNGSESREHSEAPCPGGSNRDVPFTGTLSQVEAVVLRELEQLRYGPTFLVEMKDNKSYENWYELTVRVGVLVEEHEADPDNPDESPFIDYSFVPIVGA